MDPFVPLFRPNMFETLALEYLRGVIHSGTVTQGAREEEFEGRLSERLGGRILLTNSCTSALDLAVKLIDKPRTGVAATTAQTCTATNSVLVANQYRLAWVDVDPLTGLITPATLDQWFDENPGIHFDLLMVVDWAGRPCDIRGLREVLERHGSGAVIIEDAAHAFGATRQGKKLTEGDNADFVCWSFQAIKHLTCGDGGALYCASEVDRIRARKLRWFGIDRTIPGPRFFQDIEEAGFKYHMNDVSAAIGLANLAIVDDTIASHRLHARLLHTGLAGVSAVKLPPLDLQSANWFFNVLCEQREGLQTHLAAAQVETGEVHRRNDELKAYANATRALRTSLKGLTQFGRTQLAVPCGRWVTEADLRRIVQGVRAWSSECITRPG